MERVLSGLDMAISLLDDPDTLGAELAHLNNQHKALGVPAEYFTVSGENTGNFLTVYFVIHVLLQSFFQGIALTHMIITLQI